MSYQGQGGERASPLSSCFQLNPESLERKMEILLFLAQSIGACLHQSWFYPFSPLLAECFQIEEHMVGPIKNKHRIIEWHGLEGTLKITQFQPPCHGQGCPPPVQLPRAPSNLALSTSRDGAPQLLWAAVPVPHRPLK